jgi:RNA polymerase sigma-70 factor (ECF subfamily)
VTVGAADELVETLFRREAGKVSAWLVRRLGATRLELVEDAIQDAFGAALARWPAEGVPDQPAAWLAVAARNKALDRLKRDARSMPFDESAAWRLGFAGPESLGRLDDTLALMFVACHPALERDEQTMLTLKTVCGFDVKEIARAYLSTPDAVAQRLVRAKRKIRDLNLAFEIPEGSEMTRRLPALLDTVYLLFTGGYTAGEGEALIAPELCAEALRLALLLAEHPRAGTGATQALAALLCFQHARAGARVSGAGELILLADQDRARWDRALIARGFDHLQRAMTADNLTAIHIEAGIASLHATAATFDATDWRAVAHYYAMLEELKPSAVVRLNGAIATAFAEGAAAGLARLDSLDGARKLESYALYHASRGDLLTRLGRRDDARAAFDRALDCPINNAEQEFLTRRREACR